jgi:hypothetical protein
MAMSAKSVVSTDGTEHADQAPRFLPLLTIGVRLHSPPHTDRRPIFGIISNISATGSCIITNLGLPVGVPVGLSIENRFPSGLLSVSARIVWCAERFEPLREIVGYLTGVSFDPSDVEAVRGLLGNGSFQPIP